MKAITLKALGGIENLQFEELPAPVAGPNEVLIKTKAISINPVDGFLRQNQAYLDRIIAPKNGEKVILGWDVSGTVVAVGSSVTAFKRGDDVFGMVNFPGHGKSYAEFVAAPADQLALKPATITHEEAAAATLTALTAWQALVQFAKVTKGDKVLIPAAAGGVGHYAVQIAKHFGAYVIGTGSAANRDFILSLGADEFIDYTKEKFEDRVKDADVVLDSLFGSEHLLRSLEAVKPGGRVISLLTFFEGAAGEKAAQKGVYAYRMSVVSNGGQMRTIAELLGKGILRSTLAGRHSFGEIPHLHEVVAGGKTRGKIVVTME